jgi:hypothetical protein
VQRKGVHHPIGLTTTETLGRTGSTASGGSEKPAFGELRLVRAGICCVFLIDVQPRRACSIRVPKSGVQLPPPPSNCRPMMTDDVQQKKVVKRFEKCSSPENYIPLLPSLNPDCTYRGITMDDGRCHANGSRGDPLHGKRLDPSLGKPGERGQCRRQPGAMPNVPRNRAHVDWPAGLNQSIAPPQLLHVPVCWS